MAGEFYNLPGISFMIILFAHVVVPRVDAVPYRLPGYYSYDDAFQPVKSSFNRPGFTLPGSEDHGDSANAATELKTIHYSESSASNVDGQGESRVFEISEEDRATQLLSDHEHDTSKGFDKATEDDDDADDDNTYVNHDDDDNNNSTDITDDEIAQLIEDALGDDIFLPPKKLAAWLGTGNGGTTSVKVQKTRSPQTSNSPVTQATIQRPADDRIVFPDEYHRRRVPTCANSTFCLEPEYYLSDADIENALKLRYIPPIDEPSTISERMGPEDDYVDNGLCPSKPHTIKPKTAISDDNEWYFILNNQKYVQTVRVELCPDVDKPCKIIDGFIDGYKTTCKQNYVYRQLVAIDRKDGQATIKPFKMESSCCCHVQLVKNPEMRLGVSPSRSDQQSSFPTRNRN